MARLVSRALCKHVATSREKVCCGQLRLVPQTLDQKRNSGDGFSGSRQSYSSDVVLGRQLKKAVGQVRSNKRRKHEHQKKDVVVVRDIFSTAEETNGYRKLNGEVQQVT